MQSSLPTQRAKAIFHALTLLLLLVPLACKSDGEHITEKALWLCRYNQLDRPKPEFIPARYHAGDYFIAQDLAVIAKQTNTQFRALDSDTTAQLQAMVYPAGKAVADAVAAQTECQIRIVRHDSHWAVLEITRAAPVFKGIDGAGQMARFAELLQLDTHAHRVKRVNTWLQGAHLTTSGPHKLIMHNTQQGWRAYFGLTPSAPTKVQ